MKRAGVHEPDGGPTKRQKKTGTEAAKKCTGRLTGILEPLVQSGAVAPGRFVSGQPEELQGSEGVLFGIALGECQACAFHRCHGPNASVRADDIRQRVSPWAWTDVKKLLHRRCVHSLTVQHSKDGERALLRAFLHVPHDDIEVCSCNGTPTAARVAAAAAAAAATNHRPAGGGRSGANPDGTGSETAAAGGSTAGAGEAQDSGSGDIGMAAAELAAPGTCGPPERSTHVVEVLLDTEHWALQSCSSSCCGVGYDVLHSQLCPAVAAVVLAARMGGGAEVLCEHDLGSLTAAAAADRRSAGTEAGPGSATGGPEPAAAGRSGAAAAGGGEQSGSCAWAPPELGFGPPPVARVLAAVSGGALVLGPNYVDPPAPLAASTLPGSGLPLGLQRELDCPRTIPTDIRLHLIPCCRPPASAAAAAAGPSTSTARPPPVSEPPPVPPPHIPALPAAEPGSRVNPRFAGGSFPSAAARFAFSGWYREAAPVVVANEKHRDTYRMLLPPGEEDPQPGAGAGPGPREGAGGADGGAWGPPAARPQPPPRPVQLPPPSWSFGSAGGQVSLELSGESADRFIAARAAERGPLWEMRMAFLTSHATLELDPELRLHTNTSDTPDAWPPVVLAAFDEACCPIGQPAGSHGPAGALCGLMRVMWLCLHVWEVDSGVARRAKIVAQAIAKLLLVSELPAPLRASSARLLGGWRLKLGDMAAHSRRTAYASTTDAALTDLLARLTTAYLVARDGWDAPHLLTAMGITPAPSAGPALAAADNAAAGRDRGSGGGGGCAQAAALVPAGGRWGSHQQQQQQQGSQQGEATQPPSSAGAAGVGVVAGKGASAAAAAAPARPELQPSWLGFRPAHQAAMRRLQQQQQQQQAGAGPGVGPVVMIMGPGGMMDPYGAQLSSTPPVMPFVPYAPPPLQGLVNMATPGLQEVTERLHWLGHIGLDGPYVALAAVSGEWAKAIKMLLRSPTWSALAALRWSASPPQQPRRNRPASCCTRCWGHRHSSSSSSRQGVRTRAQTRRWRHREPLRRRLQLGAAPRSARCGWARRRRRVAAAAAARARRPGAWILWWFRRLRSCHPPLWRAARAVCL